MAAEPVLVVEDLTVVFSTPRGPLAAADRVSFSVPESRTLGLVGESGCGKTVTALALLRLLPGGGRITSGRVALRGRDLLSMRERELRRLRGSEISMIFQEPLSALNPVMTAGAQVVEGIRAHERLGRRAARRKALEVLAMVGVPAPEERFDAYPHELSGGLRQRVMIAMALACGPAVLVADEPTTALDVTIQAQILDLLARLQEDLHMATLLITHDLGIVAEAAHDVVVMYAGQVVESAAAEALFDAPAHPYTRALLASIPRPGAEPGAHLPAIPGSVPDMTRSLVGCRFADRCPEVFGRCRQEPPELRRAGERHHARCFLVEA